MYKLFFALILLLSSYVTGQTGVLRGVVTEDGDPIPGVNVTIVNTLIGGVTNDEGEYRIENIPVGAQQARYSVINYGTKTIDVEIIEDRALEINVELEFQSIELEEVRVLDNRAQEQSDTRSSLINVAPENVRVMPGAVTDVFRTLQSLPGVLAVNDFSSQLAIRGSGPDQNLIIMDDVEVFNPYRLYGVVSMFNPETVTDVNLVAGGFPVRYGDRLSAVLDITNRQGNINRSFAGNINASIVSANLVFEGKNPFNIPGSWLISTRRTYYDLIIEPFVKNAGLVEEDVSFPNFFDIQAKLAFGPFKGHKFFINAIHSKDGVNVVSGEERESPDSVSVFDDSANDLLSFAWHFAPNKNMLNKLIVSWYLNEGDSDFDSRLLDPSLDRDAFEDAAPDTLEQYLVDIGFNSNYKFRKYTIDDRFNFFWGNNNELELGAGVDFIRTNINFIFDIDPQLLQFFLLNPNIRAVFDDINDQKDYTRIRLYAHNRFNIGDRLFIQPGLRWDRYNIINKSYLSPRITLSYALNDITTLRAAWGIFHQSLGYEKLRDQNRLYNFDEENLVDLRTERATHYVLSLERWLTNEWHAKVEGYYKKFDDLILQRIDDGSAYLTYPVEGGDIRYKSGWVDPFIIDADSITSLPINYSDGESYGFEVMIEKRNTYRDSRLNGWISYAYAVAEREEYGYKYPFLFDQRHTINVVLDYQVNNWFYFGARFQYGSGFPLTEAIGIFPRIILTGTDNEGNNVAEVATRGDTEEVIFDVNFGDKSNRLSSRKPEYHRLDIRLNFLADYWDLDWTFYVDIINVYNRANIINYDYSVGNDLTLQRRATTMFPILPTFGFNLRF